MDIIDLLDGFVGQMRHGRSHRFEFEHNNTIRLMDVDQLLRRYGINIYGRELEHPTRAAFLVRRSQAVWTEYLLCRAGIPLTTPLLDERNMIYADRHHSGAMPTPWDEEGVGPATIIDRAVDTILRLFG